MYAPETRGRPVARVLTNGLEVDVWATSEGLAANGEVHTATQDLVAARLVCKDLCVRAAHRALVFSLTVPLNVISCCQTLLATSSGSLAHAELEDVFGTHPHPASGERIMAAGCRCSRGCASNVGGE
jgi:hypothetical protein